MEIIPTRVHGMLDYLVGALLIVVPWVLGFTRGGAATWVPVALGAGALVYSALTDFELGLARVIPLPTHLLLDGLSGAFLAVSPWLLGFADYVWAPHLVVGLAELGVVIFSQTRPADRLAARP